MNTCDTYTYKFVAKYDLLNGIKPSRDEFGNDIDNNKPPKTSPSVPKTGGSAPAPAN